jgi:mannonate dehydratase
MIVAEFLPSLPGPIWQYALQMGIRHAIVKAAPELTGLKAPWDIDALRLTQQRFNEAGLSILGLEGDQFDMSRIKLGLDGRDEDIDRYCAMLRNMGELGIHLLCYNFMPGAGWFRTNANVRVRGGALVSGFDASKFDAPVPDDRQLASDRVWGNYEYFIRRVMPVAEAVDVRMGLHPDDPPIPSLMGVNRIFGNPEAFERAYALAPSPSNGITFCRANFSLMEASVSDLIRRYARSQRLFFLHLRAVKGNAYRFQELFHDEAADELLETLKVCHEEGFTGPLRCDHVPAFAGELNDNPGYGVLGRLFADGYVLGLLDGLGIHRSD